MIKLKIVTLVAALMLTFGAYAYAQPTGQGYQGPIQYSPGCAGALRYGNMYVCFDTVNNGWFFWSYTARAGKGDFVPIPITAGGVPVTNVACPISNNNAESESCAIGAVTPANVTGTNITANASLTSTTATTTTGTLSLTGTAANTSSTVTNQVSKTNLDGYLDVQAFIGADACTQFNNAITYAQAHNIQNIWWEPGTYTVTTECQIPSSNAAANGVMNIWAYGVVLVSTGLTTEFNVAMATNNTGVNIYGLKINDQNNTTVTTGMNFGGVYQTSCTDCWVLANSGTTASGYTAVHVGNSTAGTDTTFTQSMRFNGGGFTAPLSGCAVTLDSAFQTSFNNSKISGGAYAVCMQTDPSTGGTTARMPVFPSFTNNDIESFTTGCFYLNPGSNGTGTFWNGGNFIGNRCDRNGQGTNETTAFFTIGTNYTAGALLATAFIGNHPVGLGQYLNNTTSVAFPIASLDDEIIDSNNPSIPGYPGMTIQNGLTVDNLALQNGIGGSSGTLQIGAPTLSVGCLGASCASTQYCYKGTAVDSKGIETKSNNQVCVSTGPVALSSTGKMGVTAQPSKNHPCGYRIYGRTNGSNLLMLPASPQTCGGTTVTMLSTATGHTTGPEFMDDGSITPSGAVPTVDNTGIFQIASPADEALNVQNGGHVTSLLGTGTAPSPGTGSIVSGSTDTAFGVTGGTSPVTVTFGTGFHAAPVCVCNDVTSALGACKAVAGTGSVVITTTATDSFNAICIGK